MADELSIRNSNWPVDLGQKKLCIFGTGGFGRETLLVFIDALKGRSGENYTDHVVFMVSDDNYVEEKIMGVPVIRLTEFDVQKYKMVVAVGEPGVRKSMVELLPKQTEYATLVHPTAVISDWVELSEGTIVAAGVIVTCNIKIGKHAQLNLHTTIGHDCVIGDYFTTAPGVKISGICEFGDCVYFGTNASVKQDISICSDVTIGMGGVVVKPIVQSGVYVGSPVKEI